MCPLQLMSESLGMLKLINGFRSSCFFTMQCFQLYSYCKILTVQAFVFKLLAVKIHSRFKLSIFLFFFLILGPRSNLLQNFRKQQCRFRYNLWSQNDKRQQYFQKMKRKKERKQLDTGFRKKNIKCSKISESSWGVLKSSKKRRQIIYIKKNKSYFYSLTLCFYNFFFTLQWCCC